MSAPTEKVAGDRRTAISDAAVELLASAGTRGLTHLLIDRRLGIPDGSTSSYHRTRQALLEAAATRIVERDLEVVEATAGVGGDDAAEVLAALVVRAGQPPSRSLHLARFAMALESANNEELARAMGRSHEAHMRAAEEMLRRAGAEEPERNAGALGSYINGLILGQLTLAEPLLLEELVERLRAFLASC